MNRSSPRCLPPSRDNLLVLYFDDRAHLAQVAARLTALGHLPVEAENPYWTEHGASPSRTRIAGGSS